MREVSIAVLLDRYLERKRDAIVDFIMTNQIICPEDILPEHIKRYSSAAGTRLDVEAVKGFLRDLRRKGLVP